VIIPAYNEGKNIMKSIKFVLKGDYPKEKMEVIVVDDGSKDNTYKQATMLKNKRVKVFKKKHSGKAGTVNFGLEKSTGQIVMILDADTFPAKTCFKNIIGHFENPKIMAVLPLIKVFRPKNFIERCQVVEYTIMALIKKTFYFMGSMNCAPAGAFIRKSFIDKYGGFATDTLTEDFEMGMRIQSKNYQIAKSFKSRVYTIVPRDIKKLIRQRIRWSYGTLENIIKYKYMLNPKYGDLGIFFLPISLFSIGMVSFLFIYFIIRFFLELIEKIYLNSLINFDLIPLIEFNGRLSILNILTNEKTFLIFFTFLSSFLMYEVARRSIKEKFKLRYVFYLLVYGWILSFSQVIALISFIIRKEPKW
jgi:cellulose synthase/poly-beta-1,6-N-acetylglucosamine synthase-like glycosyltransferase